MPAPPSPAPNQVHFSSFAEGVTLMRASFTDHAFERHSHDCFAIGVTAHGSQHFRCKGRQHDSRAGEFVLFNPDEDHDGSPGTADGFGYAIWYVPEAFVRTCVDVDAGSGGNPYFGSPHRSDPQLAREFERLSGNLLAAPHDALGTETVLRSFLARLLARHGEQPSAEPTMAKRVDLAPLLRVKDYLRAHFSRDITVAELAAIAGLSRAHFTRAFGAAFHTPPHVYLNAVRIAHAQTLIRLGMPLAAVAAECGFADQSHFTRRFKGSVGISPADWRRTVLKAA